MRQPTARQSEVLRHIAEHQHIHGFSISVPELQTAMQLDSTNAVICHLDALAKKGLITRTPHQCRTIRITDKGIQALSFNPPLFVQQRAAVNSS